MTSPHLKQPLRDFVNTQPLQKCEIHLAVGAFKGVREECFLAMVPQDSSKSGQCLILSSSSRCACQGQKESHTELARELKIRTLTSILHILPQNPCFTEKCVQIIQNNVWKSSCESFGFVSLCWSLSNIPSVEMCP